MASPGANAVPLDNYQHQRTERKMCTKYANWTPKCEAKWVSVLALFADGTVNSAAHKLVPAFAGSKPGAAIVSIYTMAHGVSQRTLETHLSIKQPFTETSRSPIVGNVNERFESCIVLLAPHFAEKYLHCANSTIIPKPHRILMVTLLSLLSSPETRMASDGHPASHIWRCRAKPSGEMPHASATTGRKIRRSGGFGPTPFFSILDASLYALKDAWWQADLKRHHRFRSVQHPISDPSGLTETLRGHWRYPETYDTCLPFLVLAARSNIAKT